MLKKKNELSELRAIYKQAAEEGFWIKEISGRPGRYLATAIPIEKLKRLLRYANKGKRMIGGKKIRTLLDVYNSLQIGDVINLGLGVPGSGKTREEACRTALAENKKFFKDKRP